MPLNLVFAIVLILAGQPANLYGQTPAGTPGGAGQPPPGAAGQKPPGAANQPPAGAVAPQPLLPGQPGPPPQGITSSVPLDLAGALERARVYSQQLLSAGTAAALAREDRAQAKAALLPSLNAFNQYIYTQGNGTPSGVFVANDGVHIYNEQAQVHEDLFSYTRLADYRRSIQAEALAIARQEIARRGLVSTVVQNYYGLVTAQRHAANAQASLDDARRFLDITQKLETGGEAAHADVIKAQLQELQRERDLSDAQLAVEKARVGLGVLLFPDIQQQFSITDDLQNPAQLEPLSDVRAMALQRNPDIQAAAAGLRAAQYGVASAKGAYVPSLVLDYYYGIDANVVAIRDKEGRRNIGSVLQATVTIPVWNWGTLQSRVRQAELQTRQAQIDLQYTQRELDATISSFYLEAQGARAQLSSLQTSLTLSTESLRLTTLRYQAGEATALEVADAESTLALARNAYDDGLARYRVALAAIQTLTGAL